jgi:CRP-like cAMP-binding protein
MSPVAVAALAWIAATRPERSDGVCGALVASGIVSKTDPAALSRWCAELKPVRFPAGHVIAAGGDSGGRLYVIMSGKVEVSIRRLDGCEVVLTVLKSHEIFGVVSLFDPVACETRITALTEVLAVPIERGQLLRWMAECPELSARTLRLFARRAKEEAVMTHLSAPVVTLALCSISSFRWNAAAVGRRRPDGARPALASWPWVPTRHAW